MKVTKEMEHRFVERMCAARAFGTLSDREVRECLEAALADEPEPADEDVIGKHVWPLQAILAEAHKWRLRNDDVEFPDLDDLEEILLRDTTGAPSPVKRIAELEAKLEEVRALVRTLPDSVKPHRDEFVRILDGKEHRAGPDDAFFQRVEKERWQSVALAAEAKLKKVRALPAEWARLATEWQAQYRAMGHKDGDAVMEACVQQLVLAKKLQDILDGEP